MKNLLWIQAILCTIIAVVVGFVEFKLTINFWGFMLFGGITALQATN